MIDPGTLKVAAYILAPFIVWATTLALEIIQRVLKSDIRGGIRPFGIGFLIPITIITVMGGRGPGLLAVALSMLSIGLFLIPHSGAPTISPGDVLELGFVLVTGTIMAYAVDSLRRYGPLLHESEQSRARLRALMDNAPVGVLISNLEGAVTYSNTEADRILGRNSVGLRLDVCEYGGNGSPYRVPGKPSPSILTPCLDGERIVEREWTIANVAGGPTTLAEARATLVRGERGNAINGLVTLTDVTERKRAELVARSRANREALVNKIGNVMRSSLDPDEIQNAAVRVLGDALKVDRCYFMTYDLASDYAWIGNDYYSDDLPPIAGHYRVTELRVRPDLLYRPGRTLVVDDVHGAQIPPLLVADFDRMKLRALIGVPLYSGESLVASLVVATAENTRTWTADEILLIEAVASQTRSAVEVARLLIQERQRRRIEEITSRISQTLRYATDPAIIQARTLAIVGTELEADRCCYFAFDLTDKSFWVADDYFAHNYKTIAGDHSLAAFGSDFPALFESGATLVVSSVDSGPWSREAAEAWRSLGIASLVSTPIFVDNRLSGILVVAMANEERDWKTGDVKLIESATSQSRLTLEAARVRQREHTVAETLQRALQPLPEQSSSFTVNVYYQAALDEASVGGDFYDVYSLNDNSNVLAIGDVSGKGIAAAAQIASVRNMLRYSLDHEPNLAQAMHRLNESLVKTGQITGFATLFVSVYDRLSNTLRYVSCGHEPAIVRRADGSVTQLHSTGAPVGAFDFSEYEELTIPINPGDVVLLYTDGISEAGPNRQSMLGVDGILGLLGEREPGEHPAALVERLVDDVRTYANGIFRDDVCVVAARIEPANSANGLTLVDGGAMVSA